MTEAKQNMKTVTSWLMSEALYSLRQHSLRQRQATNTAEKLL